MMRSLWLLLLIGCEPMSEPGALFTAAEMDEPVSVEPEQAEPELSFDFPELEVISSDDLQSGNFGGDSEPEPVAAEEAPEPEPVAAEEDTEPEPVAAEEAPEPELDSAPAEEAAVESSASDGVALLAPPASAVSGWPVRLVKTLPETNPPRAILGLPNGEELVVSPGSMVPDHGLVVIAIGPNSAQIAQVTPQGDHAAVSPVTLQTMY
jgi:hypothetical protein